MTPMMLRYALLCGVASLAVPGRATAQEADHLAPPAESAAPEGNPQTEAAAAESITVTGTRIVRDGYEAPTPVTVVTAADIQKSAQINVSDYLNQLPELSNSLSPTTNRNGAMSGASFLNLRGLGINRTLVLLNGRRVVPSSLTGNVDFNLLPNNLVERVDIVTGGASSAWGSDAVAGVVNVVLDKSFTGLKGEAVYGISNKGDGRQFKVNLAYGASFADGRGHVLLSGEHSEIASIDKARSRDWFKGWNIINNPAFTAGGNEPRRLLVPGVGLSSSTPNGLITSGPLRGTQFRPDGSMSPAAFDFGVVSGLLSYGGDGYIAGSDAQLLLPVNSDTLFGRVEYEVAPALKMFVEGGYAKADSTYLVRYYQRDGNITISRQNAYLDPAVAARMDAAGVTSFAFGKLQTDLPVTTVESGRELKRAVLGGEGDLSGGWSWDAYYQYGQTEFQTAALNNPIVANYNRAVDAVDEGEILFGVPNGNIVCRSTLTSPGDGCIPINIFGQNGISQAGQSYILGTASQNTLIEQQVAAVNLRGEPFSLWAGPLSVALGVEYRKEQYNAHQPDAGSLANAYFLGNYKPSRGEYDVKEAYFEAVVPLLQDQSFAKRLEFDGAVRLTDYSTSGSVTTWKLGLNWELNDDLRFRGTYSADIRAPNLNELFQSASTTNFALRDPLTNANYSARRVIAGNLDLDPERARTMSFGAVYTPSFFSGFSAAVDYYDIKIKDSIFTPNGQTVLDECDAGNTRLCSAITRDAANMITELRVIPQNVLSERLRGIDVEASWTGSLGAGNLNIRALASHVLKRSVDAFGNVTRYDGVTGDGSGVPKWRGFGTIAYDEGSFSTTLTTRYVSGGVLNPEWGPEDIDDNDVSDRIYFDLAASVKLPALKGDIQLFGVVQNVLDKAPSVSVPTRGNSFFTTGTNAAFFDTIGRQFRIGVRIKT